MDKYFKYFKFDKNGDLLYVSKEYFIKISPPYNERADLQFASMDELVEYLETRIKFAPKSLYPTQKDGLSINLDESD